MSESSETDDNEGTHMEPKRNKFMWTPFREWDDLDTVLDFLEEEGFVDYDEKNLVKGQKIYFRCKRVPKAVKPGCAIQYVLFLPADTNQIILLHNGKNHNHAEVMAGKRQVMTDEMVDFVRRLIEKNVFSYDSIIEFIEEARRKDSLFLDEPNPNRRQIEYRLKCFRNKKIPPLFKLGDLNKWCEDNSAFPSDEDESFVIAHECSSISDHMNFRFLMSTPALLKKFIGLKQICIDATYKLNWNNFPLIILGTVDRANKFHPLIYACCSNETTNDYAFIFESVKTAMEVFFETKFGPTTLIADGALAIRNAFFSVYFDTADLGIMCFPHVLRNIMKQSFAVKTNKWLIISDIKKIQQSSNRDMFNMLCHLFCKKWVEFEPTFVAYFQKQWMGQLNNWFEGCACYTPSTNNGCESHNASVKRKITLRKRLPLNQFLVAMQRLTEIVSKQFSSNSRFIEIHPKIEREVMVNAAFMVQNKFHCFKLKISDVTMLAYLVPSQTNCEEINANEKYYKSLVKRRWESFDEFIIHGLHIFYIVRVSVAAWETKSTCTCVYFFKKNICKHIIAVGMRENVIDIPDTVNPTLLNQNRRNQGRVTCAKKALQHQE